MNSFFTACVLAVVGAGATTLAATSTTVTSSTITAAQPLSAPRTTRLAKRFEPIRCTADPGPTVVMDAINYWHADVGVITRFLEAAPKLLPEDIEFEIDEAIQSAKNEAIHLGVLGCVKGLFKSELAVVDVNYLWTWQQQKLISPLEAIADHPRNTSLITANLETINKYRCCYALEYAETIWSMTAGWEMITNAVLVTAERPSMCASIDCGVKCAGCLELGYDVEDSRTTFLGNNLAK